MARYSQVDLLSADKPKVENVKPAILISIGIQERKKTSEDLQDDCSTNYHHRHNQNRQIQEPFYVEEPKWVELDSEYMDSSRHINGDPYILSRGKKIFRIKDLEEEDKTIEDYEFIDYPSKSKTSLKNRVRRSIDIDKNYQDNTIKKNNDEKEMNHYNFLQDTNGNTNNIDMIKTETRDKKFSRIDEKSEDRKNKEKDISASHNVSIKKYKKDKLKNLAKSPRKFTKKNQISADSVITNFVGQNQKMQREDNPNNIVNHNSTVNEGKRFNDKSHFSSGKETNKRNKRSALRNRKFSEGPKRHKTYEIDWMNVNSKKSAEKNETGLFEQNKVYIDKLDNLSTYDDPFILSRGKNSLDSSKYENNANHKSIEKLWKIKYYAHRQKLKSEEQARNEMNKLEVDNGDVGKMDLQLTDKFDSKTFGIKNYSNSREKRNICETCKMGLRFQKELWWKNIQDSLSLERRDKHSDILEGLKLTEPYIISRGKKALHELKDNIFRMLKKRNENDANRAKIKTLLNMILMEKYNGDNYDTDVVKLSNKISPRDRREELDEILTYDPYYVARGKRANLNNFLIKTQLLQNQKFEMNTK